MINKSTFDVDGRFSASLGLELFRDLRIREMNINELSNSHRLPARDDSSETFGTVQMLGN